MGMAEADNGAVLVLIAGAILIHTRLILTVDVVRYRIRIGAELHDAKRGTCARKSMPHAIGADNRIDKLNEISKKR